VLLAVDGNETPSWEAYISARENSGDSIFLRLFRDGRAFEVELVLDRVPRTTVDAMAAVVTMFGPLTGGEASN